MQDPHTPPEAEAVETDGGADAVRPMPVDVPMAQGAVGATANNRAASLPLPWTTTTATTVTVMAGGVAADVPVSAPRIILLSRSPCRSARILRPAYLPLWTIYSSWPRSRRPRVR